jgi:hypothetical protein
MWRAVADELGTDPGPFTTGAIFGFCREEGIRVCDHKDRLVNFDVAEGNSGHLLAELAEDEGEGT